ncbi:MAG: hypothetical protein M3P87_03365 [Actinomycetota bacterium]|nr:hypothetical protein [Actinomycetota bacterium]
MRQLMNHDTQGSSPETDAYADPVRYLKCFGIEAELVETREADLPSAA